ncbi:hypothetical protein OAF54_00105 [bacterium]|nr:hypothetical protein [bacterium]
MTKENYTEDTHQAYRDRLIADQAEKMAAARLWAMAVAETKAMLPKFETAELEEMLQRTIDPDLERLFRAQIKRNRKKKERL